MEGLFNASGCNVGDGYALEGLRRGAAAAMVGAINIVGLLCVFGVE
jgi:hypothetical protein